MNNTNISYQWYKHTVLLQDQTTTNAKIIRKTEQSSWTLATKKKKFTKTNAKSELEKIRHKLLQQYYPSCLWYLNFNKIFYSLC